MQTTVRYSKISNYFELPLVLNSKISLNKSLLCLCELYFDSPPKIYNLSHPFGFYFTFYKYCLTKEGIPSVQWPNLGKGIFILYFEGIISKSFSSSS